MQEKEKLESAVIIGKRLSHESFYFFYCGYSFCWIERYFLSTKRSIRPIELIKSKRQDEDYKREQGLYTDDEWTEIVRLHNPQTSKDNKDLKESRKVLFEDSIMMALEDKIMKRIGQGKYFGK